MREVARIFNICKVGFSEQEKAININQKFKKWMGGEGKKIKLPNIK